MPAALFHEQREEDLVAAHDPQHVEVEDSLPLVDGDDLGAAGHHHADVVHDHVDGGELRQSPVARRDEVFGPRDVAPLGDRGGARRGDLGRDGRGPFFVDVGDQDTRASSGELVSDRATDPTPGAGHDRSRAGKIEGSQLRHGTGPYRSGARGVPGHPCRLTSPGWDGCATRRASGANSSRTRW